LSLRSPRRFAMTQKKTLVTLAAAAAFATTTLADMTAALASQRPTPPDPCSVFEAIIHYLALLF
jgi:hypothetical protein